MLILDDHEVESHLDPDAVAVAIRQAFAREYESVRMPRRLQLDLGSAVVLIMPCALSGEEFCGIKIASVRRSPEGGVAATYVVIDNQTGEVIAVLAANYLTALRTAATSAIATDLLARQDAASLGIFGTGRQAEAHIRLFTRRRRFERVLVCGSTAAKSDSFVAGMRTRYGVEMAPADAVTCASTADVICTCTNSAEPLFHGEVVRPGTHLNLIGAFQPHARETDAALITRSQVFVDTYEGCLAEAGDILVPLNSGEIQREDIKGDLHELVTGINPGRRSESEITVFKSVGCALEDLATARLLIRECKSKGSSC